MTKKTNFIDFLNNEFHDKKTKEVILKSERVKITKELKKTERVGKIEKITGLSDNERVKKVFSKKSGNNVKNKLANASKLIKTMEVFLETDGYKTSVDDQVIKQWANVYNDMQRSINRDVENLLRIKGKNKKKNTFYAVLTREIEYTPGNVLNYSVVVIFLVALSFFLTTFFPTFSNKSIAVMDSFFVNPIYKAAQINNIPTPGEYAKIRKHSNTISREQLSDYIRKNSNKIINDQNVPVEDIVGEVAGVEE